MIVQRPDLEKYNESRLFHKALSFRSDKNPEDVLPRKLLTKLNIFFKDAAMRTTLLRKELLKDTSNPPLCLLPGLLDIFYLCRVNPNEVKDLACAVSKA